MLERANRRAFWLERADSRAFWLEPATVRAWRLERADEPLGGVIALVQRVTAARVEVAGETLGTIERGVLALVGVERGDGEAEAARLAERVAGYRIFPDAEGRMNLSLADIGGGLLAVPQFTLAADTKKGMRPGFSTAAAPEEGERLFELFVALARERLSRVHSGRFGADMQVSLVNDGPVTFWLQVKPGSPAAAETA